MLNESIIDCYTKFCQIKYGHDGNKEWLLTRYPFMYPTTLMPLLEYILDKDLRVFFHPSVAGYVNQILQPNNKPVSKRTYTNIAILVPNYLEGATALDEIIHLLSRNYGGLDPLYYLLSELTSNIYDHSGFSRALVMAQEYPSKNFTEICIYDNGISIPQCFYNHGYDVDSDSYSIYQAINGTSTKLSERGRGYGMNSSTRMVIDGFDGDIFVASRNGAIYLNKNETKAYSLEGRYKLNGTLVSMRLPKTLINYSEHIKGKRTFSKFKEEKRCR